MTNQRYWGIDVSEGDLIHVQTQREHAVLEVRGDVGNRVIYTCLISDGHYYGTSDDDGMLHKRNLVTENFWIESND